MWPFAGMSLESATWWGDAANLALLACLLGGVVATFVIVRTATVKEFHWDRLREVSRAETARAAADAEAAKEGTAVAKEGAAKANAEAARANESAAIATEKAAGLEKEAAELRLALEKEVAARSPRVISDAQRVALLKALEGVPKEPVQIKPKMWDAEIKQYADQLEAVFKEAGFPVTREDAISYGIFGTFLVIKNLDARPPHLEGIHAALAAVGIATSAYAEEYVPDDKTVTVGISTKP